MRDTLQSVKRRQLLFAWRDELSSHLRQRFAELVFAFITASVAVLVLEREGEVLTEAMGLAVWLLAALISMAVVAALSFFRAKERIAKRGSWINDAFVFHAPTRAWEGYRSAADNETWIKVEVPDAPYGGLVTFIVRAENTKGVRLQVREVMASITDGKGPGLPLSSSLGPTGVRLVNGRSFEIRFIFEHNHNGRHLAIDALYVAIHNPPG